jgi:hypothetical protein
MMQVFIYEKRLKGNYNYSQNRSFLKENEGNPALVFWNVHNRTSARDGPMFGSMDGPLHEYLLPGICSPHNLVSPSPLQTV